MAISFMKELGTKYAISALAGRVDRTLARLCEQPDAVIDLAGVKFGPSSERKLRNYYGKCIFIDSENQEQNDILEHNRKVITEPEPEWPVLNFKTMKLPDKIEGYPEWTKTIPAGEYKPEVDLTSMRQKCALIFLILSRPDIDFDLCDCLHDIAHIVDSYVSIEALPEEDIYAVTLPTVKVMKKSKFREGNMFLPITFGTAKVLSFDDATVKYYTEYDRLLEFVCDELDLTEEQKETEYPMIEDFLKMRSEL